MSDEKVKIHFRPKESENHPETVPGQGDDTKKMPDDLMIERLLRAEERSRGDYLHTERNPFPWKRYLLPGCLVLLFVPLFLSISAITAFLNPKENKADDPAAQKAKAALKEHLKKKILPPINPQLQELLQEGDVKEEKAVEVLPEKKEEMPEPVQTRTDDSAKEISGEQLQATIIKPTESAHSPQESNFAEFQRILATNPDDETLRRALDYFFTFCPEDFKLHGRIVEALLQAKRVDFVRSQYLKWVQDAPDAFAANMVVALVFTEKKDSLPYLKRACALSVGSPEPFQILAAHYETERNWRLVAETYSSMLRLMPLNDEARTRYAEARIRGGEDARTVFNELKKHYNSFSMTESEKALKLLPTAQMFLPEELSETLLKPLAANPRYSDAYVFFALRHAMIFDTVPPPSVLANGSVFHSAATRQMQLLYHVSVKDFSSALLLTTPPDDFPEFWKVFISWYNNDPVWRLNVNKLIENCDRKNDVAYSMIARLWRGDLKPEDALKRIHEVPVRDEVLLFFMVAETYRKNGKTINANIRYSKTEKLPSWIYTKLVQQYKQQEK